MRGFTTLRDIGGPSSENRWGTCIASRAAPCPRRQSGRGGKDAGEVALIGKATSQCDIGQRRIGLHQKISGQLDALGQDNLERRI
jgi:hypothetical protein